MSLYEVDDIAHSETQFQRPRLIRDILIELFQDSDDPRWRAFGLTLDGGHNFACRPSRELSANHLESFHADVDPLPTALLVGEIISTRHTNGLTGHFRMLLIAQGHCQTTLDDVERLLVLAQGHNDLSQDLGTGVGGQILTQTCQFLIPLLVFDPLSFRLDLLGSRLVGFEVEVAWCVV